MPLDIKYLIELKDLPINSLPNKLYELIITQSCNVDILGERPIQRNDLIANKFLIRLDTVISILQPFLIILPPLGYSLPPSQGLHHPLSGHLCVVI